MVFNPVIKFPCLIKKLCLPRADEIYEQNGCSVAVWSQVNNDPPTPFNKTVNYGDKVRLIAVIRVNGRKYSDCPGLIKSKITRKISDLAKPVRFKWVKLESEYRFYCSRPAYEHEFRNSSWKPVTDIIFNLLALGTIKYQQTPFATNAAIVEIDQKSDTNVPITWQNMYVGTMRYNVFSTIGGITVSSYGKTALDSNKFRLKEKVHRISVKADSKNRVLDMGFAHGNLPYYYGSDSFAWGWYGSDCAKFVSVVYQRSINPKMGYQSTYALVKRPAAATINGMDGQGNFLFNNAPVRYGKEVKVGDIIVVSPTPYHHAGLIGQDKNKNGLLDKDDFILHTGGKAPVYQPLYETVFCKPNDNLKIVR